MALDTIVILQDPHPKVRKDFLLPPQNVTGSPGPLYEVPRMNSFLAILQLLAVITINAQGVYWLSIIYIRKGDYNSMRTTVKEAQKIL